jgi:transcriptional regulator with XRE-family HTH domain
VKNLRSVRKALGLSGAKLAAMVGIPERRLRRYEAAETNPGSASNPGPKTAAAIVTALGHGVTLGQLAGLEPLDLDSLSSAAGVDSARVG